MSESSANPGAWKVGGSQVGEGGEAPAFGVELITNRSKVSYGQENYYVGGDRKDRPDCCYRGLGETNRGVADQRMVCNWSCRNSKKFSALPLRRPAAAFGDVFRSGAAGNGQWNLLVALNSCQPRLAAGR